MKLNTSKIKRTAILIGIIAFFSLINLTPLLAQQTELGYKIIEPSILPEGTVGDDGKVDLYKYLEGIYKTLFVVVIIFAVLSFVIGGIEYMVSDVIPTKQKGIQRIKNSLGGLFLMIVSWLILYSINKELVTINLDLG